MSEGKPAALEAKPLPLLASLEAKWQRIQKGVEYFGERSQTATALLIAAACDEQLQARLLDKMRDDLSRDQRDELFTGYGPLSNFQGKIDLAFALGLIEREHLKALHIVRKVRNVFAHSSGKTLFTDDRVVKLLLTALPPGKTEIDGGPEQFFVSLAQAVETHHKASMKELTVEIPKDL